MVEARGCKGVAMRDFGYLGIIELLTFIMVLIILLKTTDIV